MALLKRGLLHSAILVTLALFLSLPCALGQEEELTLEHPDAFSEKHRPSVDFPHELHMGEFECLQCHHDYDENGENMLDEDSLEEGNEELLCASCHDEGTDVDLKEAFHHQCMGCHRDLRIAGDATAPELCGECHKK